MGGIYLYLNILVHCLMNNKHILNVLQQPWQWRTEDNCGYTQSQKISSTLEKKLADGSACWHSRPMRTTPWDTQEQHSCGVACFTVGEAFVHKEQNYRIRIYNRSKNMLQPLWNFLISLIQFWNVTYYSIWPDNYLWHASWSTYSDLQLYSLV